MRSQSSPSLFTFQKHMASDIITNERSSFGHMTGSMCISANHRTDHKVNKEGKMEVDLVNHCCFDLNFQYFCEYNKNTRLCHGVSQILHSETCTPLPTVVVYRALCGVFVIHHSKILRICIVSIVCPSSSIVWQRLSVKSRNSVLVSTV